MKMFEDFYPILKDKERKFYRIDTGEFRNVEIAFDTLVISEDENNEPLFKYNFISSNPELMDNPKFLKVVNELFIEVLENMDIDELVESIFKETE